MYDRNVSSSFTRWRRDVPLAACLALSVVLPQTEVQPGTHPLTGRRIAGVATDWMWLDRAEREAEEDPDRALDLIGIAPGLVVADVGAGSGYMTVRLARRVGPTGKVYANDLQPEMLRVLREKLRTERVSNVEPIQGAEDDARLPEGAIDLAIMVDVYHEMGRPQAMLQSLRRSLKPNGRLVLLEYRKEDPKVPIRLEHKMSVAEARTEITAEGFVFERVIGGLPWQHILVFRRPASAARLEAPAENSLEHLRAFAKLYGYVKYFHPSDEAARIDWQRFAMHGAATVAGTSTRAELIAALQRLFTPICPTLLLSGERFAVSASDTSPPRPPGLTLVAWQHRGDGLDLPADNVGQPRYESQRLNRLDAWSEIERARRKPRTEMLFDAHPRAGETIDKELAPGLWCRVPLTVDADDRHTYPRADARALAELERELRAIDLDTATADAEPVRLAGVVIAWNVFQHFYPYFDVVSADWDTALTEGLRRARADKTPLEFHTTLRRLLVNLRDGHVTVRHALTSAWAGLPIRVDFVEGRVVVDEAAIDSTFAAGDIVRTVDGVDATALLESGARLISGSEQRARAMALSTFGLGEEGSVASVTVERNGAARDVSVRRSSPYRWREPSRPPIGVLSGAPSAPMKTSICYVDLSRADMASIETRLLQLSAADAVIFDLRGYPKNNHDVLRHLIDGPVASAQWRVPLVIYPDRERSAGVDTSGRWRLEPKAPRFSGRAVFITDARAISYAESVMGIVEHYQLGEIVGASTAGANGNVNRFDLPGGYKVAWTGMQVLKHDGSQHHLIGIRPTVPAERTLAGVRAGRDELLEQAIEVGRRRRLAPLVR
jgi:SAM-dependent methyltransferase/C-terminal processing protease CtpA/Prc